MPSIVNHPDNGSVKLLSPAPGGNAGVALQTNFTYLGTLGNTVAGLSSTSTQTLTNKTISGSSNTITNIGNSSLSSGIDAAKIGDGSVSNTEFGYIDGLTSNVQIQLTSLEEGKYSVVIGAGENNLMAFAGGGGIYDTGIDYNNVLTVDSTLDPRRRRRRCGCTAPSRRAAKAARARRGSRGSQV